MVLGYLDPRFFAGGRLQLRADLAHNVIEDRIGRPLGMSVAQAALGIHRVLNTQMAEGIRLVSVRQGIDPRSYALVPLGGAGGIHATALARELGITQVIVPRIPGVLAAAGLLAAPIEHEVSTAFPTPLAALDVPALSRALEGLDRRASALMAAERVQPEEVRISYFADLCYIGQSYNLEIPIRLEGDLGDCLYREFLEAHERVYGHSVESPAKIVNIRTVHQARGSEVLTEMRFTSSGGSAEIGCREIVVGGEPASVLATVLDRDALAPGFRFKGPAIVQQSDTTTLVEPGWDGLVDEPGNLVLQRS